MADLLGPKGKQIEDHSLEMLDLPLATEAGAMIIAGDDLIFRHTAAILEDDGSFLLDNDGKFLTF